jgi:hypothetical protein
MILLHCMHEKPFSKNNQLSMPDIDYFDILLLR